MSSQFAFVFPGQGSQTVGMLSDFMQEYSCVAETFQEVGDALDYDLQSLILNGPAATLNETIHTQPAMLAADIAVYRCWCELSSARPSLLAGHSLGEYAALVVADVIPLTTAARLVKARAHCMSEAVPEGVGAMAAIIGLDEAAVDELCEQAAEGEIVQPANYNSVGQVVIAGHTAAVGRAIVLAKAAGAKLAKLIPVSVPSHSPLMQNAFDAFLPVLAQVEFATPSLPIIHNVDVAIHADANELPQVLAQQLIAPVRWVETVHQLKAKGVELCIECGPGKVLPGLIKRIDCDMQIAATGTLALLQAASERV